MLWAALLIATGVTATVKAVTAAKRSTLSSQRTTEATKIASAELEQLKAYSYKSLGMTGNITGGTGGVNLPTADCTRFVTASNSTCPTGATIATQLKIKVQRNAGTTPVTEEIVEPQTGGIDSDSSNTSGAPGLVPTTAKTVAVGGDARTSNFRVYRYVTWHDENCDFNADNTSTGEDDCTAPRNTKTVIVGVEPRDANGGTIGAGEPGPNSVVWLSAVVSNPADGSAGGGCANGPCGSANSNLKSQRFYLYDTTCDKTSRQNQTSGHRTHLTTAQAGGGWNTTTKNVSACKNSSISSSSSDCRFPSDDPWTSYVEAQTKNDSRCIPDLMGPQPPPQQSESTSDEAADPMRYSADVWAIGPSSGTAGPTNFPQRWGYGPASALLQRTAGCPASAPPTNTTGGSSVNAASIHTWATPELVPGKFQSSGQKGFYVSGRMALDFWVSSYDPTNAGSAGTGKGKLCITLIDRDEYDGLSGSAGTNADPWHSDKIIYQFGCEINRVPLGANEHWTSSQAKSTDAIDRRAGKHLPIRRSCRFIPGYGQTNWANNYVTSAKSQVFPPPVTDPGPRTAPTVRRPVRRARAAAPASSTATATATTTTATWSATATGCCCESRTSPPTGPRSAPTARSTTSRSPTTTRPRRARSRSQPSTGRCGSRPALANRHGKDAFNKQPPLGPWNPLAPGRPGDSDRALGDGDDAGLHVRGGDGSHQVTARLPVREEPRQRAGGGRHRTQRDSLPPQPTAPGARSLRHLREHRQRGQVASQHAGGQCER